MNKMQLYKLNEIILGLEKVLVRYKYFFKKFLTDNSELIKTPIGQEIMKIIQNGVQNNPNNQFSKILSCLNVNNNDLVLNYNLDNFQKFAEENPELVEVFNDPALKSMSDFADEYKWASQCLIVNVDTYINIFFKLMYDIEIDKKLPKGFNDNPKFNFYESFPRIKGKLDYEFALYNELHVTRNNIVHNGIIADEKLLSKLSIKDGDFAGGLLMYLPNFDKVVLYALACFEIVIVVNDEILKVSKIYLEKSKREKFINI